MTLCPFCGYQNIEGVEDCEGCQQSLSDLADAPATEVERSLMFDSVSALSPKAPVTVDAATSVRDVLQILVDKGIGCVLVEDQGKLAGIFTERDCVKKIGSQVSDSLDDPVSKYMTADPNTLEADDKIAFAVQRMDHGGYRHVPIADDGKATGIVSVRDLLGYLVETMQSD